MKREYFTISKAEAHLPALSTLLKRAQELKGMLDRQITQRVTTSGREELYTDLHDLDQNEAKEEFYNVVERIEKYGCVLRDVDEGIINFYTRFEGRDVFLCWKIGTKRINFWHEIDEDYSDRKKIIAI